MLRGKSNAVYQFTPAQMIAVTDAAKAFKKQHLATSWSRKDAIDSALAVGNREAIEKVI